MSDPGPIPVAQGGEDADHCERRRALVADGDACLGRRAVREPAAGHQTRLGLDDDVQRRSLALRPGLAETRDRAVHESRVELVRRLVPEPERGERTRPVVLDQDVGTLEQSLQDAATVRIGEVELDAALASAALHVTDGDAVRTAHPYGSVG